MLSLIKDQPNSNNNVDFRSKKVLKKLNMLSSGEYICPCCNNSQLIINHLSGAAICEGGCEPGKIIEAVVNSTSSAKGSNEKIEGLDQVLNVLMDTYKRDIRFNTLFRQYEIFIRDTKSKNYLTYQVIDIDKFVVTVALDLGLTISDNWATKAVQYIGDYNLYNPVTSYLENVNSTDQSYWRVLREILGLKNDYHLDVIGGWLYGAVMRAFNPGCKNDLVLILQGEQGIGKSSFFKIMGGQWYTDQFNDYHSRDDRMNVIRHWIIEWAELSVFNTAKQSVIDSFVTSTVDTLRKPYGRDLVDYKRMAVFGGTTNEIQIFDKARGHRRYAVIPLEKVDLQSLQQNRDQIWGSITCNYILNNNLYLRVLDSIHTSGTSYEIDDPWLDYLSEVLEDTRSITVSDCHTLLAIPSYQQNMSTAKRIGEILKALRFKKKHTKRGNVWEKN